MNIDLMKAKLKQADELYQHLVNEKVPPADVVATIQQIDEIYHLIFKTLGDHLAMYSDIQSQDFYHHAKRSFYAFLDREYQANKTYAEIKAQSVVMNTYPGILEQFKVYLRDRNAYIERVKGFLHYLNLSVNGTNSNQGMFSARQPYQCSRLETINEIKRLAKLEKGASDDVLLDLLAQIQMLIRSNEVVKILFAREQEFLDGFAFLSQYVKRDARLQVARRI